MKVERISISISRLQVGLYIDLYAGYSKRTHSIAREHILYANFKAASRFIYRLVCRLICRLGNYHAVCRLTCRLMCRSIGLYM